MSQTNLNIESISMVSFNEKDILKEVTLEKIVQLNFNEETLKRNFEIIIKYLRMLKDGHSNTQKELDDLRALMEKQQKENLDLIKQNQQSENLKKELQSMKDQIKENEKNISSVQQTESTSKLQEIIQSLLFYKQKDNQKLKEDSQKLQEDSQKLKEDSQNLKEDSQKIKEDNQKIREENEKYKEENASLRESIERLREMLALLKEKVDKFGVSDQQENKIDQLLEQKFILLKELQRQVNDLNERLKYLETKGNSSTKNELDALHQDLLTLRLQLNKLNGLAVQDGEKSELHQLIQNGSSSNQSQPEKIVELDNNMKQILQDLTESVTHNLGQKKLQQKKDENTLKTERELEDIKNDLKHLEKATQKTQNINKQDDKLTARQREIEELKRIMDNYYDTKLKGGDSSSGSGGAVGSLIDDKINKMRKEIMALLKGLKEDLNNKADKSDLLKLEEYLNNKLKEMDSLYNEKFANKEDTLQALSFLEKKINNLYQIIKQMQKPPQAEDGIFVRKPIWSCIVCDKGQQNYNGKLGQHKVWNQFPVPKENSPERANGKFAKGYRNMQETAKQRNQLKYQSNTNVSTGSPDNSLIRQNSVEATGTYTNPYITDDYKTPEKLPPVYEQSSVSYTQRNQRNRANNLSTYI